MRANPALDATLSDADWPLIQQLWRAGVTNAGIYRMLRLRSLRRRSAPELDGFEQDRHALLFGDVRARVDGRTGDAGDGGTGAGVPADDGWTLRHRPRH